MRYLSAEEINKLLAAIQENLIKPCGADSVAEQKKTLSKVKETKVALSKNDIDHLINALKKISDEMAIKDPIDDLAVGETVSFPDTCAEPTEQYFCNLKREPWEYPHKLRKLAIDCKVKNLKINVAQNENEQTK